MGLFLTFDAVGLGVFTIIGATRINHGISLMVSADASGLQKGVICLNKFCWSTCVRFIDLRGSQSRNFQYYLHHFCNSSELWQYIINGICL